MGKPEWSAAPDAPSKEKVELATDQVEGEEEEKEEIDPENPPCCDGCDRPFPQGEKDLKLKKQLNYDRFKIRFCKKCWRSMSPSVKAYFIYKMKEDTCFTVDFP